MNEEFEKNDKEIRILDAARDLFGRYGLKKTSIEEIARLAGLGKGTVYLYFRSKEEIFAAVVEHFGRELTELLASEVAKVSGFSNKVEMYIHVRLRFVFDMIKKNGITADIMDEAACTPAVMRIKDTFGSQQIALLKTIIEEGVKAGEFETRDSEVSALAIFVAMDCLDKPWSFQGRELAFEDKVKALIELYLVGLKKRAT